MTTWTARCYCGTQHLTFDAAPQVVAFCHCGDCRRWTGAPAPAFAAFDDTQLTATPQLPEALVQVCGVERWNCTVCGSPMLARFGYLPGQFYVPVGVLDNAESLSPDLHCHADNALPWLHITDDLPRHHNSARDVLRRTAP